MACRSPRSRSASASLRQRMYRAAPTLTSFKQKRDLAPPAASSGVEGHSLSGMGRRMTALLRSRAPRMYPSLRSSDTAIGNRTNHALATLTT